MLRNRFHDSKTCGAVEWCRRLVQIVAKHFARIFGGGYPFDFFAKSCKPTRERPMAALVVSTDAGDFAIQEHEVSTITTVELCQLRISRADLRRLFAEAAKLLLVPTIADE